MNRRILILLFVLVLASLVCYAENTIESWASLSSTKRAADYLVQTQFSDYTLTLFDVLHYYDLNDERIADVYVYAKNTKWLGKKPMLLNEIFNHMLDIDNGEVTKQLRVSIDNGELENQVDRLHGIDEKWRAASAYDDFISVYVSASKDRMPIWEFREGVPEAYNLYLVQKLLELDIYPDYDDDFRIYYNGPMQVFIKASNDEYMYNLHSGHKLMKESSLGDQFALRSFDVDAHSKLSQIWALLEQNSLDDLLSRTDFDNRSQVFIPHVPYFRQGDWSGNNSIFPQAGSCSVMSAASVLFYYDHFYWNMVPQAYKVGQNQAEYQSASSGFFSYPGVSRVIDHDNTCGTGYLHYGLEESLYDLAQDMGYDYIGGSTPCPYIWDWHPGMQEYSNDRRGLDFSYTVKTNIPGFDPHNYDQIKEQINLSCPMKIQVNYFNWDDSYDNFPDNENQGAVSHDVAIVAYSDNFLIDGIPYQNFIGVYTNGNTDYGTVYWNYDNLVSAQTGNLPWTMAITPGGSPGLFILPPTLVSPQNNEIVDPGQVTLSWEDVGASEYKVQLSRYHTFDTYSEFITDQISIEIPIATRGVFFWRVMPKNPLGTWCHFSEIFSFTIENIVDFPHAEDFSNAQGESMPIPWKADHTTWSVVNSQQAGGQSPEVRFGFTPFVNGVSRLIYPINHAGYSSLGLYFKHALDINTPGWGVTLELQTSSDMINWQTQWSIDPPDDIASETVFVELNNLIGDNTNIALVFIGNNTRIIGWYIDDVQIVLGSPQTLIPPQNLQAFPGDGVVQLNWQCPIVRREYDGGADRYQLQGYNIYRNGSQLNASIISTTNYADNDVTNDVTYSYYVTAVYLEGESSQSNVVYATPGGNLSEFAGGMGSADNPYRVTQHQHLNNLRNYLNNQDVYFSLLNDIDLSGEFGSNGAYFNNGAGWIPIGTDANPFKGNFDGNGYKIDGLYINRPTESSLGLFGSTLYSSISNLHLSNVSITGNSYQGSLSGKVSSTSITNCISDGNLSAVSGSYLGGLIGSISSSTINNCGSSVHVSSTNGSTIGGLVGLSSSSSTINLSYATGSVSVTGNVVGGLVGDNASLSSISKSYSSGMVSGGSMVGGVAGRNQSGSGTTCYVSDSYSTGSVIGSGSQIGGLVGKNGQYNSSSTWYGGSINRSFSTGLVAGSSSFGGLVGSTASASSVNGSYWDMETSGRTSSSGGTGKTTAQMMQLATFSGWNVSIVWSIDEGQTYPYLRTMYAPPKNLVAIPGTGVVQLSWNMPTSRSGSDEESDGTMEAVRNISYYSVFRDGTWLANTSNRVYSDTSVSNNNSTYRYHIVAVYPDGQSQPSNVAIAIPLGTSIVEQLPWNESFTGTSIGEIPPGWNRSHTNWAVNNSSDAGGSSPEMRFGWSPSGIGVMRLISPRIHLDIVPDMLLSFKHMVNDYSGGYILKVQTSPDMDNWTTVWSSSPTTNVTPRTAQVNISNMPGNVFYIAWVFEGNSYNVNYWHIDDVTLIQRPGFRLEGQSTNGTAHLRWFDEANGLRSGNSEVIPDLDKKAIIYQKEENDVIVMGISIQQSRNYTYSVYRDSTLIYTAPNSITSYIDPDTQIGNTYSYYVSIENEDGILYSSNVVDIEIQGTIVLDVPEVSISISDGNIVLEWDLIRNANSYVVLASDSPETEDAAWERIAIIEDTSYTETLIEKRFYRVIASTDAFTITNSILTYPSYNE
ncbi:MAG: hypothetical protein PHD87_03120 [Candidatus Cloacimonetes bacterium]|nr:hypothetical protein [Candidatus Cloacimonadota bacterium]